jgi:hypothetical protein
MISKKKHMKKACDVGDGVIALEGKVRLDATHKDVLARTVKPDAVVVVTVLGGAKRNFDLLG